MGAKLAGYVVVALFACVLIAAMAIKGGLGYAMAVWATALLGAFVFAWAVGAIVYDDWWPFRNL